jgi:hypothetical protein
VSEGGWQGQIKLKKSKVGLRNKTFNISKKEVMYQEKV